MSGEVKIYLSNYNPGALIDFGSLLGFWQFSPNKIGTIVIINIKENWLVRLYCMYIDLILYHLLTTHYTTTHHITRSHASNTLVGRYISSASTYIG